LQKKKKTHQNQPNKKQMAEISRRSVWEDFLEEERKK
jgi:hypothetical protein